MQIVSPQAPRPPAPKKKHNHCLIVLISWDDSNTQEKLQTMIMQNLGGRGGGGGGRGWVLDTDKANMKSLLDDWICGRTVQR